MTILNFKYWSLRKWEMWRWRPPVAISPRIICALYLSLPLYWAAFCSSDVVRLLISPARFSAPAPHSGRLHHNILLLLLLLLPLLTIGAEKKQGNVINKTRKRKDAQELNRLLKALGRINKHTRSLLFLFPLLVGIVGTKTPNVYFSI